MAAGRSGNTLIRSLALVSTPGFYVALLGSLEVGLLMVARGYYGPWPALGAAICLAGALLALRLLGAASPTSRALVIGLVVLCTVLPTVLGMEIRQSVGLTQEHDGMVQIEAAIDRLLRGEQIYGVDWSNTQVAQVPYGPGPNPALHHFGYFPLTVLVGIPFKVVASLLHLPFDYRAVLLAFVGGGVLAITCLPVSADRQLMLLAALYLNPLVSIFVWSGRTDIAYLSVIMAGLAFLARRHPVLASLSFGVALALRPFALFALPFVGVALWRTHWRAARTVPWREVGICAASIAAPVVLSVAPFFLHDPRAFWDDVILYVSGGLPDSYPPGGYGLAGILVGFGLIGLASRLPFGLFQLAALLPSGWWAGIRLWQRPTLGRLMAAYSLSLFVFLFFARFFNDNYAGGLASLVACIPPLRSERL